MSNNHQQYYSNTTTTTTTSSSSTGTTNDVVRSEQQQQQGSSLSQLSSSQVLLDSPHHNRLDGTGNNNNNNNNNNSTSTSSTYSTTRYNNNNNQVKILSFIRDGIVFIRSYLTLLYTYIQQQLVVVVLSWMNHHNSHSHSHKSNNNKSNHHHNHHHHKSNNNYHKSIHKKNASSSHRRKLLQSICIVFICFYTTIITYLYVKEHYYYYYNDHHQHHHQQQQHYYKSLFKIMNTTNTKVSSFLLLSLSKQHQNQNQQQQIQFNPNNNNNNYHNLNTTLESMKCYNYIDTINTNQRKIDYIHWKDTIIYPKLCTTNTNNNNYNYNNNNMLQQLQIQLNELLYNHSQYSLVHCYTQCIYTIQSYYSYQYGHPIHGYHLSKQQSIMKNTNKDTSKNNDTDNLLIEDDTFYCWKPFISYYRNLPCGILHYNTWIQHMEQQIQSRQSRQSQRQSQQKQKQSTSSVSSTSSSTISTFPSYECTSRIQEQHQSEIEMITTTTTSHHHKHNKHSGNCYKNLYIQNYINLYNQKYNQQMKKTRTMTMTTYTYNHLISFIFTNIILLSSSEQQQQQQKSSSGGSVSVSNKSPFCNIQNIMNRYNENIYYNEIHHNRITASPGEIVLLYDMYQLGLHDLYDSIILYNHHYHYHYNNNDTNKENDHNDSDQPLIQCIYHKHSLPYIDPISKNSIQYPTIIKGWIYRISKSCFVPIKDMEFSHISNNLCGPNSIQYHTWIQYHTQQLLSSINRQQQQQQQQQELESQQQEQKCHVTTTCDLLPLPNGRYYWNETINQAIHVVVTNDHIESNNLDNDSSNDNNNINTTTSQQQDITEMSSTPTDNQICGPRIIIIGAMKCGTNTIGTLLNRHPRVRINTCPSSALPYCNLQYFQGDSIITNTNTTSQSIWENHGLSDAYMTDPMNYIGIYTQKFPITYIYDDESNNNNNNTDSNYHPMSTITFDKSPSYLNTELYPNIAERIKEILPNSKIIISLCHPIQRMYSEYNHIIHETKYGGKESNDLFYMDQNVPIPSNFSHLIEYFQDHHKSSIHKGSSSSSSISLSSICHNKHHFCYALFRDKLRTGIYHNHIRHWYNVYGRENVLILNMEDTNYNKMKQMISFVHGNNNNNNDSTCDILPENEYPWDSIIQTESTTASTNNNETNTNTNQQPNQQHNHKQFKNMNYNGRYNVHIEHPIAYQWLHDYFYQHNIILSKEINATWPLQWNEIL